MCGIAGILNLDGRPVDPDDLRAMCDAMVHRGPDDRGTFVDNNIGLGMQRLSIIDVEHGRQPVSNEDGSITVVFNGEIYNYPELRRDLIARGHALASHSDTEVIVHLYEEVGRNVVDHLRGMFAFALWDGNRRQLLLARDRIGIKPLYYANTGRQLVFASELKAILQLPFIQRRIDWNAIDHLLLTLTTPATQSAIRGVEKLEPAHILAAGADGQTRLERYWDVAFEPNRRANEQSLIEELRGRIDESVRMHMISDVPVGAFLSGGIDSSSVVAAMVRHSERPIRTFSVGFREAAFNELPHARTVAQRFATEHHERVVTADAASVIADIAWHLDEPFGDSSAIPTWFVAQHAADHVKVVLSGDGGDELFAGYDKYRVEQRERRVRMPRMLRKAMRAASASMREGARGRNFLLHHGLAGWDRYLDSSAFFRRDERARLLHRDVIAQIDDNDPLRDVRQRLQRKGIHWLSAAQDLDLHHYLPLDVLTKVDRMSMAHSLEVRVPLLDHKLVEFAATIPPELQPGKRMLKNAMRGVLPDAIIDRPKRGFAVPLSFWFRGAMRELAADVLLSKRSTERGMLDTRSVARLLDLHRRGRNLDLQIWTLMSFELWCRSYVDTPAARSVARASA